MASVVPRQILTHNQRVCRLYKKALKTTYDNIAERVEFRYEAVLVRARFDAHKNEKDARVVAALIAAGEQECWDKQAYDKFIYADDEGGITEGRQAPHFDQMLDYWHPWERANFLDYFKKRDDMKKLYANYWEESLSKKFGDKKPGDVEYPIISPEVAALK